MKHPLVGTVQVVFYTHYPDGWRRDIGDNSQFWKQAMILDVQDHPLAHEATATVKFLHNERVSRGHFLSGMNHCRGCIGYAGVVTGHETPPREQSELYSPCKWCHKFVTSACQCKQRSEAVQCPLSL